MSDTEFGGRKIKVMGVKAPPSEPGEPEKKNAEENNVITVETLIFD